MSIYRPALLIGIIFMFLSCTGQKPAKLKNSSLPNQPFKTSCSSITFAGQVLNKKNILNVFNCSGWENQYPELFRTIQNAQEEHINEVLKAFNDSFFSDKQKRKKFYQLISETQGLGELNAIVLFLEKSLSEKKILSQLNTTYQAKDQSLSHLAVLMTPISNSNIENVKFVNTLKNIASEIQLHKVNLRKMLTEKQKSQLTIRVVQIIDDLAKNMRPKHWSYMSQLFYENNSALKDWAHDGSISDLDILLKTIQNPTIEKDINFFNLSLKNGILCRNRAQESDFVIDVAAELKYKFEILKNEEQVFFERSLLDGLTKYIAFESFCEEKEAQQGLQSFYSIVKHAFNIVASERDFKFLKIMHQVFQEDRFAFIGFLSSPSFSAIRRQLIDLGQDGNDEEFTRSILTMLGNLSEADFQLMSETMQDLAAHDTNLKKWLDSFIAFWNESGSQEKLEFVDSFGLFFDEEIDSSLSLNFVLKLFESFPEFSPSLAKQLSDEQFQFKLRSLINHFSKEKVQKELSVFLSRHGLFQLIQLMTQTAQENPKRAIEQKTTKNPIAFVEKLSIQDVNQTRKCFDQLTLNYEKDSDYYAIVNQLPDSCLSILGQTGFVGQIYLWMNSSNLYFEKKYQITNYHSATGVWSPGMLQFIFTAAIEADRVLASSTQSHGLKENLDEIHQTLTDKNFLESFHLFSNLFTDLNIKFHLDESITEWVTAKTNTELGHVTKNFFTLLKFQKPYLRVEAKPSSCLELEGNIGAKNCLSSKEATKEIIDLLRILKRKNEVGDSLLKGLITWLHPDGGIGLPFNKSRDRQHYATLDQVITFLIDLSSSTTKRNFTYHSAKGKEVFAGTTLDRLEVLIREIGFSNNFYGAYFKNQVASAADYKKEIIKSEKLLYLLEKAGAPLRTIRAFPIETKTKLKNVSSTYNSLLEVADNYQRPDSSQRSYGDFIQGLLSVIGKTSKLSTQDFNPYQKPDGNLAEGHNGIFLTKVVQLSGLRRLSLYARSRFGDGESVLKSQDFKMVNKNLIGRHSLIKLKNSFQKIFDKYLDHDRNQLNILIEDMVTFVSDLSFEDQKKLEEILAKVVILLSDENVSQESIASLSNVAEIFIDSWPELRILVMSLDNKNVLLNWLNENLDKVLGHPQEFNQIMNEFLKQNSFELADLKVMFRDPVLMSKLANFLKHYLLKNDCESKLNWLETFQFIFAHPQAKWEPLRLWLQSTNAPQYNKLTLSVLISFLGEKEGNSYKLQQVIDELFLNHRDELNLFLNETFKSLELKPD